MFRNISLRAALMPAAAAVTALVLTGCGAGHAGMDHGSGAAPTATASSAIGAFNDADVAFAQGMIPHHQQAVRMAQLAATRAADPEVKALAEQIRAAQDPEIATMTGWLRTWQRPTAMPGHETGHQGMPGMMSDAQLATLEAASGRDFDRMFSELMIAHHEGAVTMAQQELANGANPAAKELAQRIVTAQQAEIATMKALLARL
ncbi:DUF305 domain-containing protein [Catellatospora chokoriensis]|uniref:Lipoprotein n=1 Tax=Catellatospora chokoriensis TaxID=310353 RepID=A0A8J3K2K5_9ACTN|nr:DUF305 domain-containing protein [Catellatospora chokoriensis]GIF91643.1 lipoprotein [Catellatospora chokoriensis]